jgi:thiol:disulfide interchange protein
MELTTFHDPAIEKELARFTLVKVDCTRGDDDPEVAAAQEKYKADTLPTLAIVDSTGQIATTIHKVVDAKELLPILQKIK